MALAATIGFFDGVHTGHQFVLERLSQIAAENGLKPAAVIFEDHPQEVLRGVQVPLLTTFEERVALLKNNGIQEVLPFRFEAIRSLKAEEFMKLLREQYDVRLLVMGYDHHFGSDRLTEYADYQACAMRVGMQLLRLPQNPDSPASSTKIRQALALGNIEEANRLLGYPYSLTGTVVAGKQIGRKIGFPTANLSVPKEKLIPAAGVYACEVDGHKALLNIGTNPTVNGTEQTIELHLLDFTGDLYGKRMNVKLLRFIRPDRKFDSIDDLRRQIQSDVEALK